MKKWMVPALLAIILGVLAACERPGNFVEEGDLSFSVDTVKFDTIFTTFQAPTERLIVTNNTQNNINISRVWLDAGSGSEFNLIINGLEINDLNDVELARDDSIYIFVTMKSVERDKFARDYINFQVGENTQRILIQAFVLDAYFFSGRVRNDTIFPYVFARDTTLTPEKPIVMDGFIIVNEGVTVTIEAGTQLFFTPYKFEFTLFSGLYVGGSLQVNGTPGNPVIFQGTRLEEDYFENPAQWRGIRLLPGSGASRIEHAVIKNGLIGVEVDSLNLNNVPTLTMRYSEIRNMGAYGVLGAHFAPQISLPPSILMENCLVRNCKEKTVILAGGGKYEFNNCTFANYSRDFTRNTPQLTVNDALVIDNTIEGVYPLDASFVNCIVYGSEEEELLLENLGNSFNLRFDHCLIRTSDDPDREYDYSPYFEECILNRDPIFNDLGASDPAARDFRPRLGSPVIDAGTDLSQRFQDDIRNDPMFSRQLPFDIGAYEYYEIE
ncbi:MAG: right-handed parallel beta-helix repeat-containing protein [Bacteroidota bacterium]